MINKIENWSYDKPTEEGDYLVCLGDVETPANIEFERFRYGEDGLLECGLGGLASEYHKSYKFARLVYAPSELAKLKD